MEPLKILANVLTGYSGLERTEEVIEVEVLTVHFLSNKMRVRYYADIHNEGKMKVRTVDIPADEFFEQVTVTPNKGVK